MCFENDDVCWFKPASDLFIFLFSPPLSLTIEEFVHAANKFGQITPMEIDILYQLSGLHSQTG